MTGILSRMSRLKMSGEHSVDCSEVWLCVRAWPDENPIDRTNHGISLRVQLAEPHVGTAPEVTAAR